MNETLRIAVGNVSRSLLAPALLSAALAVPTQAAEVHVSVNIGGPPAVIVHRAPTLVYLHEPAVYAAVGIPYDIFVVSGRYYYSRGDDWFWAPGYRGPWTPVRYKSLPPGLRKFKVAGLRSYRDHEYRIYRDRDYRGEHFDRDRDDRGDRYNVSYKPSKGRGKAKGHR